MEKIFYTDKCAFAHSNEALEYLLSHAFGINDAKIAKTENGKPYLENYPRVHFSISHTDDKLFFAFSSDNVGIDAEKITRKVCFQPIVKKFAKIEQDEISSSADFLKHWIAKEAAIKWLGATIASDLSALYFIKGELFYKQLPLPVHVHFFTLENHLVCVCAEREFENAECIEFSNHQ